MSTKKEERELFNFVDKVILDLKNYCRDLPYLVNCKLDRQFYYQGDNLKTAEPEMFVSLKVAPRFELRFSIRRNKRNIGSRYSVFGQIFIQEKPVDFVMADRIDASDPEHVLFYVKNILYHFDFSFPKV